MSAPVTSPTVRHWFEDDAGWFRNKALRAARNFGTSRDVDIYGFDLHGWNEQGVDRAGMSPGDYAEYPSLEVIVSRLARQIGPSYDPVSPLKKTLPASRIAMDVLFGAWPHASMSDSIAGLDVAGDARVSILRTYEADGGVSVSLCVEPEWPETGRMWSRGLSIEFGVVAAMQAADPVGTVSFGLTVDDGGHEPEWTAVTDLQTAEDVALAVEDAMRTFNPGWLVYAISVVDGPDEGRLAATAVSDLDADEGETRLAGLVDGDLICTQHALEEIDALERLRRSGRLRSSALIDMLERGMEAAAGISTEPSPL